MNEETKGIFRLALKGITLTVICDNNPYEKGLETAWGFSCVITAAEKTILFDTGPAASLLLDNMSRLAIEPNSIEIVVLSHIHDDHTGGLEGFLAKNPSVVVYLPEAFPKKFKDKVKGYGTKIVEVEQPLKICEGIFSTGRLRGWIKEQALVIQTEGGLIIITGCAHPGIVKIVNAARDLFKDEVLLVMGGFHLEWTSTARVEKIISTFRRLNVRYAGPCHCTGEKARNLFGKHFGENYINIGAGKIINIADD